MDDHEPRFMIIQTTSRIELQECHRLSFLMYITGSESHFMLAAANNHPRNWDKNDSEPIIYRQKGIEQLFTVYGIDS